jgi:aryl-alcohol dehydrogenase-like predicted oxidoreductase
MEMRTLGRNGPRVSAMGLGCTHAWVLSRGEDIVPLVGMSQPARVADNLRAFDVTLGKQDLADLDQTFALGAITGDRYPAHVQHLAAK